MKDLSPYPMSEDSVPDLVTTSVQFSQDLYSRIEFIARFWNALDAARGVKRRHKWKPASVIRRLCLVASADVINGIGGMPESDVDQATAIEVAAAKLAGEFASANSAKK